MLLLPIFLALSLYSLLYCISSKDSYLTASNDSCICQMTDNVYKNDISIIVQKNNN